jgi:hypothetical protein
LEYLACLRPTLLVYTKSVIVTAKSDNVKDFM